MTAPLHPSAALYGTERALPVLPPCVHYAGSERYIRKALELQRERAKAMAALIAGTENIHGRVGARIHDLSHPAWRSELAILIGTAGDRIAFVTLPKAESAADRSEEHTSELQSRENLVC